MKLLALSDLQLGAGAHLAPDRLADQAGMLAQVTDLATAEQVELVVIAGDVYEDRTPTREEDEVFADWLASLHDRGLPVVAAAGNHDWRGFERPSTVRLFRRLGLDVVERPDVRRFPGGTVLGFLPWIAPGHLLASRNGGDRDAVHDEVAALLLRTAQDLRDSHEDGPIILVSHFWIEGAGKVDRSLIAEPVLPVADLAALNFDAVIGGHVHEPAVLHDRPLVLMCGSPWVCSWGETGEAHGVWTLDTTVGVPIFHPLADREFVTVDLDLQEVRA